MKKLISAPLLLWLMAFGSIAAAVTYTMASNTAPVTWTLSCGSSNCVFLSTGPYGNSTSIDYALELLSTSNLVQSNLYINTTLTQSPSNVIYALNATAPSISKTGHYYWLNGPINNVLPNSKTIMAFHLAYNGTYGAYTLAANVLQA